MPSRYTVSSEELTSIANAIRTKSGTNSSLVFPTGFVSAINSISSSGIDTSDANATASDILYNKTAYVNGSKITGNIQTKTSSDLTASELTVTAPAGYYAQSATKTLTDSNLIAGNIKDGTTIFGVTGTYVTPNNYPTFTIVSNNNSTTVTCDKTYSECLAYVYNGTMMADIVFDGVHLPFTCINEPTNDTIIYSTTAVSDEYGINTLRILYTSSGTITYDEIYVDKQDSSTLTASGATVTAPAGYYPSAATKTIASGTEGTPTATKGSVSNHAISVTPSVTNTAGYISGGTHSGTAVSVSASELVSGTKSISANGTGIDVTNYASVDVTVPSGPTPTSLELISSNSTQVKNGDPLFQFETNDSYVYYFSPKLTIDKTYKIYVERINSVTYEYYDSGWVDYVASNTSTSIGYGVNITDSLAYSSSTSRISKVWIFDPDEISVYSPIVVRQMAPITANPIATKDTVSNHSISVTPSITTSSGGYLASGTKTGTSVTVTASELVSGTKSITANETGIDVTNYASVDVSVSPSLQAKTNITPTESSQTISADSGYDGLSSVQINAISSTYVGSGITSRSSSDLSASGATVTVPAGYYSTQASKAISNGSATGPSSLSGSSATVTTGTNTITLTKTGVSTTPTVSAGYVSSATSSTATVALTASVTTKAAATITPGTTNQTIASGTYLTGTQTISGDSNLVASNIISGKTIFGVSGSVVIQHYYTGSSTPSSSTGVNGDIYLKTS